jgi:exonuclease III
MSEHKIKICTWNCTSLFSGSHDDIAEKFLTTAKNENYDVICMQGQKKGSFHIEKGTSKWHRQVAQKMAEYDFFVVDTEYRCGVTTFFSSRMIKESRITRFSIEMHEDEKKLYHESFIIDDLTLTNVYLPHSQHFEQYMKLGDTLCETDTPSEIVVGDFNFLTRLSRDMLPRWDGFEKERRDRFEKRLEIRRAAIKKHRQMKYDFMQNLHGLVLHETKQPTCGNFSPDLVYSYNVQPINPPTVLCDYLPEGYTHLHRPVLFECYVNESKPCSTARILFDANDHGILLGRSII